MTSTETVKDRLEYLRGELRAARISYGELAELQSLAEHIEPGDVELLEAAGVPEHQTRATYLLTIEGPDDFDFDLDDAGAAIAAHVRREGEDVAWVVLERVDGATLERNRISAETVEQRVTSPWSVKR